MAELNSSDEARGRGLRSRSNQRKRYKATCLMSQPGITYLELLDRLLDLFDLDFTKSFDLEKSLPGCRMY